MCVLFRYSRFFFSLLSLPSLHTYARVCVAGPALRERSEEQIKSHRTLPSWWPFLFVSRHSFRKETEILGCSDVAALPSSLSMSAAPAAASTGGGDGTWSVRIAKRRCRRKSSANPGEGGASSLMDLASQGATTLRPRAPLRHGDPRFASRCLAYSGRNPASCHDAMHAGRRT